MAANDELSSTEMDDCRASTLWGPAAADGGGCDLGLLQRSVGCLREQRAHHVVYPQPYGRLGCGGEQTSDCALCNVSQGASSLL